MKKVNIGIFGSCSSIDPFRSHYNNYKKNFNKLFVQQNSSIISLTNPRFDYKKEDITFEAENNADNYLNDCFEKDFGRFLLSNLDNVDYLVIDVFNDVRWGVLILDDKIITNAMGYVNNIEFYKKNQDKIKTLHVLGSEVEYLKLWKESCDFLFDYINKNYPHVKIILNRVRCVEWIHTKDGFCLNESFHNDLNFNRPLQILEDYIIENYEVDVIEFPNHMCADENNIWGPYSVHYLAYYYKYVFNQIQCFIFEDCLSDYEIKMNELSEFKMKILNSNSWKITEPFRKIGKIIKSL